MTVRRAFTFAELLVVLAIVAVTAAVLTPVFLNVRRSARREETVQHMRQLWMALSQYRADYEGVDIYDNYRALALPSGPFWDPKLLRVPDDVWNTACNPDPVIQRTGPTPGPYGRIPYVGGMYSDVVLKFPYTNVPYVNYLKEFRQNIVVFLDPYCNDAGTSMSDTYKTKRGFAVTIEGQIVRSLKKGDASRLQWYSPRPTD